MGKKIIKLYTFYQFTQCTVYPSVKKMHRCEQNKPKRYGMGRQGCVWKWRWGGPCALEQARDCGGGKGRLQIVHWTKQNHPAVCKQHSKLIYFSLAFHSDWGAKFRVVIMQRSLKNRLWGRDFCVGVLLGTVLIGTTLVRKWGKQDCADRGVQGDAMLPDWASSTGSSCTQRVLQHCYTLWQWGQDFAPHSNHSLVRLPWQGGISLGKVFPLVGNNPQRWM